MTDVTGIIGTTLGAIPASTAPVRASDTTASTVAQTTPGGDKPIAASSTAVNPLAGVVVTQYFDGQGDEVTQVPSHVIVAYLQNGLTPQGFPKETFPPQHTTVA